MSNEILKAINVFKLVYKLVFVNCMEPTAGIENLKAKHPTKQFSNPATMRAEPMFLDHARMFEIKKKDWIGISYEVCQKAAVVIPF